MTAVSVIVNTYNRAAYLEPAIRSLLGQSHRDFEIIVVNGPSTDETKQVLRGFARDISVLECAEQNLSVSRNIGVAAARGDVVAFIDDDAVAEPHWLAQLTLGFDDPAIAAVGGFVLDPSGVEYQHRVVLCDLFGDAVILPDLGAIELVTPDFHDPRFRFISTTGCNCAFRKEDLLAIGGFDPTYAWLLEETDVCLRLIKAGRDVTLVPAAVVHHRYAESHLRSKERIPRSYVRQMTSKTYFALRHALPAFGEAKVNAYLEGFIRDRTRDVEYFRSRNFLDRADADRLVRELADGDRSGRVASESSRVAPDAFQPLLRTPSAGSQRPIRIPPGRERAMETLSLCLVSQQYPPAPSGGIGVWTSQAAKGLAADGHTVSVVTRGDKRSVDWQDGVWVHTVPAADATLARHMARFETIPASFRAANDVVADEVVRIAGLRGLDLVSMPIWDLEGFPLLRMPAFCPVLSLHTTYGLALQSKLDWQDHPDRLRGFVEPMIRSEKVALEIAPAILANSEAIVRDLEDLHAMTIDRNKLWVVPHGVPDRFVPSLGGGPDDPLRVLFVGRLEKRKGIDTFLAAMDEITRNGNVIVDIAGADTHDGSVSDRDRDRLAATGTTTFHGNVGDVALHDLYARADVVVLPSRYESFGLTVIEAMMHGKAVVSRAVGGIREIITPGVDGILLDSDRPNAWSEAITAVLADPQRRRMLGANARRTYEQRYSIARMTEGLLAAYRGIIARTHLGARLHAGARARGGPCPPGYGVAPPS